MPTKSVNLKIIADAGKAKEALDSITRQADELGLKDVRIGVSVEDGKAKVQLQSVKRDAEEATRNRKIDIGVNVSKALGGLRTLGLALAATAAIPVGAQLAAGIGAMLPVVAAAGIGVAGFAAVAIPAIKNVAGQNSALTAAQQKVTSAQQKLTAVQEQYGVKSKQAQSATKALTTAQLEYKQTLDSLPPAERSFAASLTSAKAEYMSWAKSLQAPVLGALTAGLKQAKPLLDSLTPAVRGTAAAFKTLAPEVSMALQALIGSVGKLSGPVILGLGRSLDNIIVGITGVIQAFAPFVPTVVGGIQKATAAFAAWGNSLQGSSGFKSFMDYVKSNAPALKSLLENLAVALGHTVMALRGLGGGALGGLSLMATLLAHLSAGQIQGLAALIGIIKAITIAVRAWSVAQGVLNIVMAINPVVLIIAAIVALIAIIVVVATKTKFFQTVWHAVWGGVKTAFDATFGFIKKNWPYIVGILAGPLGVVAALIFKHWNDVKQWTRDAWNAVVNTLHSAWSSVANAVSGGVRTVISFVSSLPSRIWSALSGLASMLFNIGWNAITGLWNGIVGVANRVLSWVENFAKSIVKAFGWVLKIFSPSKVFAEHGKNLVLGLIEGMQNTAPKAISVTHGLAESVSGAMSAGSASGTSGALSAARGQPVNVNVTFNGLVTDPNATAQQIRQVLLTLKRNQGGGQLGIA